MQVGFDSVQYTSWIWSLLLIPYAYTIINHLPVTVTGMVSLVLPTTP